MTAKELIENKMPEMFKSQKAKRYNRTIQLDISGEKGGKWWLEVANQELSINPGEKEDAKLLLEISDEDFVALFTGQVKAMNLVTSKRLVFSGPMTEGIAFMSLWDIPKP